MSFQTIISVADLADHLNVPDWLILDCRAQFLGNDQSYTKFKDSHIPNAFYCSFLKNYIPNNGNNISNIYDFSCNPTNMLENLTVNGFDQSSQIIIYDYNSGSFTDTFWLQLRSLGCKNVAVLQGGFETWIAQKMPVTESISAVVANKTV